jgi:hypothetical protein
MHREAAAGRHFTCDDRKPSVRAVAHDEQGAGEKELRMRWLADLPEM